MKHLSDAEIATGLPGPCPSGPVENRSMRANAATLMNQPDGPRGCAPAVRAAERADVQEGVTRRAER